MRVPRVGCRPGSTVNRTISLHRDLKAQMAAVQGVNWSRIAAKAFEVELGAVALGEEETLGARQLRELTEAVVVVGKRLDDIHELHVALLEILASGLQVRLGD